MTRDKILVEREYDGERCGGESCPQYHVENDYTPSYCSAFERDHDEGNEFFGFNMDGRHRALRLRACLSTPGVDVRDEKTTWVDVGECSGQFDVGV